MPRHEIIIPKATMRWTMQQATRDVLYFEIGPDNEPTLRVAPGEEFQVETQLNRGPWLNDHPDRDELGRKLRGGNPSQRMHLRRGRPARSSLSRPHRRD